MTDEALHTCARILLRVCSPARACRILARMGALLPPRRTMTEVRLAATRMGQRGTCLSRAMTVAARAPEADIIIAVGASRESPFFAHAWLELAGEPLDRSDIAGHEIVRLRRGRVRRGVSPVAETVRPTSV